MDDKQRRDRIVQYLQIKPINHGQIYTFQIAIPQNEVSKIPLEREEYLRNSLTQQGTNLIPLIVRRTDAYTEEEEYEVIYGADWCLAAKELDIEKLWVWVFDLTDEQAKTVKSEMEYLLGFSSDGDTELSELLDQKLKPIYTKINQPIAEVRKSDSDEKLRLIDHKIEHLSSAIEQLSTLVKQILPPPKPPKLNLLTASESEIKNRLLENGLYSRQIEAAVQAIMYWKKSDSALTWGNLKKSTFSGEHKIHNFGDSTYKKLKEFTDIRDD
jgi:hypothetical protein